MEDGESRIAKSHPQASLELRWGVDLAELDDQPPRGGRIHLSLELPGHEADGHDPVLLGGPEELLARPLQSGFVFEGHLREARESVANVRFVVDRQTPPAPRIHVGEGALGQLLSILGAELAHERSTYAASGSRHGNARDR